MGRRRRWEEGEDGKKKMGRRRRWEEGVVGKKDKMGRRIRWEEWEEEDGRRRRW